MFGTIGCFDRFLRVVYRSDKSLLSHQVCEDGPASTERRKGEEFRKANDGPISLEDFFSVSIGLVAEYAGSIPLAVVCSASSSIHLAVKSDPRMSQILRHRPYFIGCPCAGPWGLNPDLDVLLQHGVKGCSDADGGVVIGSCGLQSGRAAFHFSMRDFPGCLVGVTTLAPDSKASFCEVIDTDKSLLFSAGGGVLNSAPLVNEPPFTHWPIPQVMTLDIAFIVEIDAGTTSVHIQGADDLHECTKVPCSHLRGPLFPVVAATHLAQSMFCSGSGQVLYRTLVA